jgi:hypothetical protein
LPQIRIRKRKQYIAIMARRGGKKNMWAWLLPVAGLVTALLIWLEWLGSEQPMQIREIPVQAPATKAGSRN